MTTNEMITLLTTGLALTGLAAATPPPSSDQLAFEQTDQGVWKEVFSDLCTGDWTEKWFLDGEIGSVETSADGMRHLFAHQKPRNGLLLPSEQCGAPGHCRRTDRPAPYVHPLCLL